MERVRTATLGLVLLSSLGACNGGTPEDPTTSAPVTTTHGSTTEAPASSSGAVVDDAAETGMPKLDTPVGTMGDDGIETGDDSCKKVDLLFVIDDSGSMADEQADLAVSVPGFIAAVQNELAETEGYNIGVITTDLYIFDVSCAPLSIGRLITETGGEFSTMQECGPYSSGLRFMTEDDNLDDKFNCAARVGISGDGDEKPMEAMLTALTPPLTDPGGCNEGFLRDDALLVVVLITDEEDDHETEQTACDQTPLPGSAGDPGTWFEDLVAVKGGDESKIVVLSLVGPDAEAGTMCPALDKCNGGVEGAEVAPRILEFTRMFTYGFVGPVCEDYAPIFQESIAVIKTACEEFDPQG